MTQEPPRGAIGGTRRRDNFNLGPFVANAEQIGDNLWLVDRQRGAAGKGKVWDKSVVRLLDPAPVQDSQWFFHSPWQEILRVRKGEGYRGTGKWRITNEFGSYIEIHLDDRDKAIALMVELARNYLP